MAEVLFYRYQRAEPVLARTFPDEGTRIENGLVRHEVMSASTQVRILTIVDETGTAAVGDIIAELSDHPDPVGAIMVMVRLGILVLELDGPLDAHTLVRRADPDPEPEPEFSTRPPAPACAAMAEPTSTVQCLPGSSFAATVVIGAGLTAGILPALRHRASRVFTA